MGRLLAVVGLAGLCIYVGRKLVRWHRFMREFRLARITPEELKERLDAGEGVFVVDLQGGRRHSRDRQGIPGAVRIDPHRLEQYRPRDKKRRSPAIVRWSFTALVRMSSRALAWLSRCSGGDSSAFDRLPGAFGLGENGASL
jgi:hypothetical protein